jgi:S-DNA-T family DNA segregation ATPase FtsK/SpoIIIE
VQVAPVPGLLAVSTRPAALTFGGAAVRRLGDPGFHDTAAHADPSAALVGSPDEWQARWSVLRQLAATHPVLFDGCTPAEVRSLLGRQELPPPCAGRPRWLFRPGEPPVRARL